MGAGVTTITPTLAHTFPGGHILRVSELLKRWEIAPRTLLEPCGLSEDALAEPHARVSAQTLAAVLRRARALTGEPGLGFYLGLQKRITSYGQLGIATLSASTVREALDLVVSLSHSISTGLTLSLRDEGELAALTVTEHVDMGDVQDIVALNFYVGIVQNTRDLVGRPFEGSIDLMFPEPEYFPRFAHLLPEVRFEQPISQILFRAEYLDTPLPRPDPAALSLAKRECERTMSELGFEQSLAGRVRQRVIGPDGARTIEQVAASLHTSSRTLKRRLAEQGYSFTGLREQEAKDRALHLLRSSRLPMSDIAMQLGYSTLPNFARAFRRWTGTSPASYRESMRSSGGLVDRAPEDGPGDGDEGGEGSG